MIGLNTRRASVDLLSKFIGFVELGFRKPDNGNELRLLIELELCVDIAINLM